MCARRWAYNKIEKLSDPGTAATARGTAIHSEMEAYGLFGTAPTSVQAKALLAFAPLPGVAEIEVPVAFSTPSSDWLGYVDFACDWDDQLGYAPLCSTGHTLIGDWKSCSRLSNALSENKLREDIAANVYSLEAFWGGAKRVSLLWIYVDPAGKVKPVRVEMNLRDVTERMIVLDAEAAKMQRLWAIRPKAKDVEANEKSCFLFPPDGCPYYSECQPVREAGYGRGLKFFEESK